MLSVNCPVMIVFDFQCICGCQFEGWFENRTDFEKQTDAGIIFCPRCGGDAIHKILAPVAIHTGFSALPCQQSPDGAVVDANVTSETALQFLNSLRDYVEKNFDDVGLKLAEESLKIHYGVIEPRNIRGVATAEEEKMLSREGIELLKIPLLKKLSDPKLN